jgi:hypothetical protein
MGDKNNESESNIPAGDSSRLTATISTRASNKHQQWIIGSHYRLGKGIMMSDKNNEIDIPADCITQTAIISTRARIRNQQLIFRSQESRSVGRKG